MKTFPAIPYRIIPTDGRPHLADANPSLTAIPLDIGKATR